MIKDELFMTDLLMTELAPTKLPTKIWSLNIIHVVVLKPAVVVVAPAAI